MKKDYYAILGITKNATADDIKKAYRRLAHVYHPDKQGGDEAKFKEVNEAYQVLSNAEKRKQYDQFGKTFDGPGAAPGGGFSGAQWGWGGAPGGGFEGGPEWNDIFDAVFEGFGGGGGRRTYERGADLEVPLTITLEEAKQGKHIDLDFETHVQCATCGGVGHDEKAGSTTCSKCGGRGEVRETRKTFFGDFAKVARCDTCMGTGKVPNKVCVACKGTGRVYGHKKLVIDIRPGVEDGQIIRMPGMGEAGAHRAGSGDVYVRIKIRPHQVFVRRGQDLYMTVSVRVMDVLLGRPIIVRLLGGGSREVIVPPGFDLASELRIKGEGMTPRNDLIIRLDVRTPKKLDAKTKELLEELAKRLKE